jgi:hypothetical protein
MGNSAGPKITKDGLVLDFDAANPKSYNFYADPYASNVSLHLKMDGANGSTTFTDSSPNALVVTAVGNAQISTTQSKYNGSAGYFDGTGDYLTVANYGSLFTFGTGDFTVEAWVYVTSSSTAFSFLLTEGSSTDFAFYVDNTRLGMWDGASSSYYSNAGSVPLNQWVHVALARSGGFIRGFVNGVLTGSVSNSRNMTNSQAVRVVGSSTFPNSSTCYVDELKITKGVARYTSAFTSPPIPSTCTDLTRSKNVGTLTSGVDYNFSNGGSLVFDGVNDYVNIPASTNLTFGTGDFTMEVWCKTRAKTMLYPALLSVNLAWASNVWVLIDRHNSTAPTKFTFHVYNIASPMLTSVTAPSNGVWYNVVVTRIGTLFSLYINGVLESTATSSGSIDGGVSNSINLGRQSVSDSTNYDGNIPRARIYKGKGLTSTEVYNNFVANRGRFGV